MHIRLTTIAIVLLLNSNVDAVDFLVGLQSERRISGAFKENVNCLLNLQASLTGNFDVDETKSLSLKAVGQSTASLSGFAGTLRLRVDGQSRVEFSDFKVRNFELCEVSGQGKLKGSLEVDASNTLTIRTTGQARVSLSGAAGKVRVYADGQSAVDLSKLMVESFEVCEAYCQSEVKGPLASDASSTLTMRVSGQARVALAGAVGQVRASVDSPTAVDFSKLQVGTIEKLPESKKRIDNSPMINLWEASSNWGSYGKLFAVAVILFGVIWFDWKAFRVTLWWGIGCLCFVAMGPFTIVHFRKAARPVIVMAISALFYRLLCQVEMDATFWSIDVSSRFLVYCAVSSPEFLLMVLLAMLLATSRLWLIAPKRLAVQTQPLPTDAKNMSGNRILMLRNQLALIRRKGPA